MAAAEHDDELGDWIAEQLRHAPPLSARQAALIVRTLASSAAVGTDQHHGPEPGPAPTRAAG